jgi:hypothetical protein
MATLFDSVEFDGDRLTVRAYLDDAVQVAPATRFDPPAFGSALCECVMLWDESYGEPPLHSEHLLMVLAEAADNWEAVLSDDL